MAYVYQVLSSDQVRLLDEYSGAMHKVKLSELLDSVMDVAASGAFTNIVVSNNASIGNDLTVVGATVLATLQVGGGYGDTGVTIDADGNLSADGVGDFAASGLQTTVYTPATAAATGEKGMITYDTSYIYVCVDTDTWMRGAIATW